MWPDLFGWYSCLSFLRPVRDRQKFAFGMPRPRRL